MTKTKEPKSLLERWVAVAQAVVNAGGSFPYEMRQFAGQGPWLLRREGEIVAITPEAIIAVLEKWVREVVREWALREYLLRLCMPRPRVTPGFWDWAIDGVPGTSTRRVNGTEVTSEEAFLCVAEALCECLEVG